MTPSVFITYAVLRILLNNVPFMKGEGLSTYHMKTSVRTISASEINAGYFTPYQSR